jgi:hypothetical protein
MVADIIVDLRDIAVSLGVKLGDENAWMVAGTTTVANCGF